MGSYTLKFESKKISIISVNATCLPGMREDTYTYICEGLDYEKNSSKYFKLSKDDEGIVILPDPKDLGGRIEERCRIIDISPPRSNPLVIKFIIIKKEIATIY